MKLASPRSVVSPPATIISAMKRGDLLPGQPLARLRPALRDPGDQVRSGLLRARLDEPVDVGGEPGVGLDAARPARLLAGQRRDDLGSDLGQVRIVVSLHAEDRGDDLERQRHRQARPSGRPVRSSGSWSTGRRRPCRSAAVVRLELPADEDRGDDRPPDVVVVAVHLDHRRADDVGEDPLVRAGSSRCRGRGTPSRRRRSGSAASGRRRCRGTAAGRAGALPDRERDRRSTARRGGRRARPSWHHRDGRPGRRWEERSGARVCEYATRRSARAGQTRVHHGEFAGAVAFDPNAVGFVRPTRV